MGRLFKPIFERNGHQVLISGRTTSVTPKEAASDCDLVIISVPIRDTLAVIRDIGPCMGSGQVLADFTSIKEQPVRAMLETKAQVLGMHPMFGPGLTTIKGQTIVLTPARIDPSRLEEISCIFEAEGSVVTRTTPEQHDRMMAVVQGLTHFVSLVIAETMRQSDLDPQVADTFTSPVYRMEMGIVGRLLSQEPSLYADIMLENRHVPRVLEEGLSAWTRIRNTVLSSDRQGFEKIFMENSDFFGDYSDKCRDYTDTIISRVVGP